MQLPGTTDAACDINELRLELNALGNAKFQRDIKPRGSDLKRSVRCRNRFRSRGRCKQERL